MSMPEAFRALHAAGCFAMPNPWDRGSARLLEDLGYPALATTSAGLGRAIGKDDQEVTRDELVAHVAELTAVIGVPLNVDGERLFPDRPGGIAETVRLLADAGAAGCSIEDYDPAASAIEGLDAAVDAVAQAVRACAEHGLVLTARAENHLYGVDDLDDTIARLNAFVAAGADVAYAPGLATAEQLARVVGEVDAPVSVLSATTDLTLDELAALGVRRVSTGSALFNAAYATIGAEADRQFVGRPPTPQPRVDAGIDLATVVVDDYDAAIAFFCDALAFDLVEDSAGLTNDGRPKRWVVVRPGGGATGTGLLLARADSDAQRAAVGAQTGGRVAFFLRVSDFDAALDRMTDAGVTFHGEPRVEPYGRVVVFSDLAGNRWDLLGPASS
ncbi:MAG: isocitrate lyase/phosphoenolpyruvate mutase family protein [Microthrixaceae bacterium]